jgi:hypothetical protein
MADVERMYLNGEWVLAEGGATFADTNPAAPVPPAAVWTASVSADPDMMFAASRSGDLDRRDDGGDSWRTRWRECGEVSSIFWVRRS